MVSSRVQRSALLRTTRSLLNVRQVMVAKALGLAPMALGHIEAGRRPARPEFLLEFGEYLLPGRGAQFAEALLDPGPEVVRRVAELVSPSNPEAFDQLYAEELQKAELVDEGRSAKADEIAAGINRKVRGRGSLDPSDGFLSLATMGSMGSAGSRSRSVEQHVIKRLREQLATKAIQFVETTGPVDLGSGIQLPIDLIDISRRIAVEVRQLRRGDPSVVVEAVGKATVARKADFTYVVCCPRRPDGATVEVLKSFGVPVVWFDETDRERLAGDRLWE